MRRGDRGLVLGLHRSGHPRLILEHALAAGVDRLDTAYNYVGGTSHRTLAEIAPDLLGRFAISTKVGFFPTPDGRTHHSLDPARLRAALEDTIATLGLAPQVVLLHNPERALPGADRAGELRRLATACTVLHDAATAGLCHTWGLSTWDPRPIRAALAATTPAAAGIPAPQVMMVRAGLLVTADVLDAADELATVFALPPSARWGMSPFGGTLARPVWDTINPRTFLAPHQDATLAQALLRVAFALPQVTRVAVGTDNPDHLDALAAAVDLRIDEATITRYRTLLRTAAVTDAAR